MDERKMEPEELLQQLQELIKRLRQKGLGPMLFVIPIIAVLLWAASGIYMVQPGEQAVVRMFGKEVGITEPGLRYQLPYPIQTHDTVNIANVRRAEIGFRNGDAGTPGDTQRIPEEALMLTGDENIVEAQLVVQYVVQNPSDFLFKVKDPEQTLRAAAEVALRGAVGKTTIDQTMTEGRVLVEQEVQATLQSLMDLYETGILVTQSKLLVVDPPESVKDAFHEVVRAYEDKERLVQEAEGYRENLIPRARGRALEIIQQAEAYKERRTLEAQGDAERFTEVLESYSKAKVVTRQRLYLEMIEEVMPGVKKYIIEGQGDGNLLQLLPLGGTEGVKVSNEK